MHGWWIGEVSYRTSLMTFINILFTFELFETKFIKGRLLGVETWLLKYLGRRLGLKLRGAVDLDRRPLVWHCTLFVFYQSKEAHRNSSISGMWVAKSTKVVVYLIASSLIVFHVSLASVFCLRLCWVIPSWTVWNCFQCYRFCCLLWLNSRWFRINSCMKI